MKLIYLALFASLSLSGCASGHYLSSNITDEINQNSVINQDGHGEITSEYGSHNIHINVEEYRIQRINNKSRALDIKVNGLVDIKGSPYASTPAFTAKVSGEAHWLKNGKFHLKISSASDIELQNISKLHLFGIRNKVKDIIAITLVEHENVVLDNITKEEGISARFWNF